MNLQRLSKQLSSDGIDARVRSFLDGMLPQQRAFIADPSRTKLALCSRRAGKTYTCLGYFFRACLENRNVKCLYVALTHGSAKNIVWDALHQLDRSLHLRLRFNEVELKATFDNGSSIRLAGADKRKEIEKFRGEKFKVVALDECGSFDDHIKALVDEVLSPALMDQWGDLLMLGTPSERQAGLFYEACTNRELGWSVHTWTFRENSFLDRPLEWLAKEMEKRAITEESPVYLREYCGIWARGSDRLVYQFDPVKNTYDELPKLSDFLLGMDYGFRDDTAFVTVGYSKTDPTLYVVDAYKRPGMLSDDIVGQIERIKLRFPVQRLIGDSGGYGTAPIEEIKKRHGLYIHPAVKSKNYKKAAFGEINTELRKGLIKLPVNSPLADEWQQLLLTEDGKEDPACANHLSDAFVYAFQGSQHFRSKPIVPFVPPTLAEEEMSMYKSVARAAAKRQTNYQDEVFQYEQAD